MAPPATPPTQTWDRLPEAKAWTPGCATLLEELKLAMILAVGPSSLAQAQTRGRYIQNNHWLRLLGMSVVVLKSDLHQGNTGVVWCVAENSGKGGTRNILINSLSYFTIGYDKR
jgi:hypothetical protein